MYFIRFLNISEYKTVLDSALQLDNQ